MVTTQHPTDDERHTNDLGLERVSKLNLLPTKSIADTQEAPTHADKLSQLESANRELLEFAYVVSHDLKAPLRGVSSIASWMLADYADKLDDQGRELMQLMIDRLRRMDQLIDGVLEYSRVGRTQETLTSFDLSILLNDIINDVVPPERVHVIIDTPMPTLILNVVRVRQLFQNLIDNAVKYMDKPLGEIHIGCRLENGWWVFRLQDNGPGIESQYFERIFQLFQTLNLATDVEPTGIGLTIVKSIIEHYGGRIWLESTLGEGSTFYFTLPA